MGTNAHFSGIVFSSDTDLNKLNANMERLYKYFFQKSAEEMKSIIDSMEPK